MHAAKFKKLYVELLDDPRLTIYDCVAHAVVADRMNGDGIAWPSSETIARDGKMSPRKARSCIQKLVALGYLTVRHGRHSNVYGLSSQAAPRAGCDSSQAAPRAGCSDSQAAPRAGVRRHDVPTNQTQGTRPRKKQEGAAPAPSPIAHTDLKSSSEVGECIAAWARGRKHRNPDDTFPSKERAKVAAILKRLLGDYGPQAVQRAISGWWEADRPNYCSAFFAADMDGNAGVLPDASPRTRALGTAGGPPPARPGGLLPISEHEDACL